MPPARTALEHLLDARSAIVQEAQRLAAALAELDALIATIGGEEVTATLDTAESPGPAAQPVKPTAPQRTRTPAPPRKAASRRSAATRRPPTGAAPKSIRVHVLEMLGEQDREFGLAEIIDRIHAAGIQAHDDAVRSITIKLMKDGQVERVGRGQYRLARGASVSTAETPDEPVADAPEPVTETPSEPAAPYSPPLNLNEPWVGPQG